MTAFRWAYFWLFAYIGCYGPFMTVWLRDGLGKDDAMAGRMMAVTVVVGIAASLSLSRWVDRTRKRRELQRWLATASALFLPLWLIVPRDYALVLSIVHGLLVPVQIPLLDAAVLDALGDQRHRYGRMRLFGTIGWGFGMLVLSSLREHCPPQAIIVGQFLAFAVFAVVATRLVDSQPKVSGRTNAPLLAEPGFWLVVCVGGLHGLAVAHFEYFSARHLESEGLKPMQTGLVLGIGILAETALFWFAPQFIARVPGRVLLALALAVSAARWMGVAHASTLTQFALLQACHAFTFGLWYASTLQITTRLSNGEARTTAQAIVTAVFGVGAALGGLLAGLLRVEWGPLRTFEINAAIELVALLLLVLGWSTIAPKTPRPFPKALG